MRNEVKSAIGGKKRLDILVSEKFGFSRAKAQAMIMAGEVFVSGKPASKPGQEFPADVEIETKEKFPYVSRGALKLQRAYEEFKLDFTDKIICDVGASTGGFTDFALQHGSKKVYAIDTGYGQIAQKLREDPRVVLMEKTNIKNRLFCS
jgi:23S rRNA (cytidine1920-2'-O)/16S rRNA (cytidine1409-2'-O)-methyltransferase